MKSNLKITISTGIYPPKIGGPAQYAKNLKETFEKMGHKVSIKTFSLEDYLPSGVRHLYFLFKVIPTILVSDVVFILDTFSVALPTVLCCKIFGKKSIIRTGGDFLWEQYIERTGKKVLFRNFYDTEKENFSKKEKDIFLMTKWILKNSTKIIFSTVWQRDIFVKAYGIDINKTVIIENYYGPKEGSIEAEMPNFIASTRDLVWKNLDVLRKVFDNIQIKHLEVQLYTKNTSFEVFMKEIKSSYAVILVSLGDISPNMILDAIRYNKPFICTREIGIYERIKEIGIFVDPLNGEEIEKAVLNLLNKENYEKAIQKVQSFNFTHTWEEIAQEYLDIYKKI